MKHFLYLLGFVLILSLPVLANTENFTLVTDASGNASQQDSIPFGVFRLSSFVSTDSFSNVKVLLDGTAVFDAAVVAGQNYAVSGAARNTIQFQASGGPANKTVTVTVTYTWTSTLEVPTERDTQNVTLTTDASGNTYQQDSIPFGVFRLSNFKSTDSFTNVQFSLDGKTIFNGAVIAGQTYSVSGEGRKTMILQGSGGPASKTVTVTVSYTWTPTAGSRDTQSVTLTTDANGNAEQKDRIPFGIVRLSSFQSSDSFANIKVALDGTAIFNGAVAASQTYNVTGSGKEALALSATGGIPNKTVSVIVTYTWTPFDEIRDNNTFTLATDDNGNASQKDNISFGVCNLTSFSVDESFANIEIMLDGNTVFDREATAGEVYVVNGKGRKNLAFIATGGLANHKVTTTVNYNWTPFSTFRDIANCNLVTDQNGNASQQDSIPFGVFRLSSFSSTDSFANVKVLLDGQVIFNAPVTAGNSYSITGAGTKTLAFQATGGPANKTVTVTVNYTWTASLNK